MEDRFRGILTALPEVNSRSRLEPYRELIREMRNRRYSYREITRVLAGKCALRVSQSTLHDFVQRYLINKPPTLEGVGGEERAVEARFEAEMPESAKRRSSEPAPGRELEERIAAIKRRPLVVPNDSSQFQFDTSEPLRLKPGKS